MTLSDDCRRQLVEEHGCVTEAAAGVVAKTL